MDGNELMSGAGAAGITPGRGRWLFPVLLAGTILLASARSEVAGPDLPHTDKLAHLLVFGLLATLMARALPRRRWWWGAVGASLFGVGDEALQSLTPERVVEVADWLADTVGAVVAVGLYCRWSVYRRVLEQPLRWRSKRRIAKATGTVPDNCP